ncbi:TPA: mechanosensitive ion channel [Candidatus Gracilibacteria bacterium]|nr:mechanosensitive ion channel [Candidatus Gracilibacteria bacterium]
MSYLPIVVVAGTKLIIVILTLYIGFKVIEKLVFVMKTLFVKKKLDKTLSGFLISIIRNILKVLLVLSMVTYLGIPTASFVAILGAAGLAIGMALSGTLQNFAGGAMLLAFRPFKVGDFVELAGHSGTVEEIQIFNTILTTGDNKMIIIPNAECSSSSMINYSTHAMRRVDLVIGIGYEDNIETAKSVLQNIANIHEKIVNKKEILIAVSELGSSSVDIAFRVWVKSSDYWSVKFELLEIIKKEFDAEKISFPYPQRDIHVYNEGK